MSAVLIHADSVRSADMRHAVPVAIPDPFLYVERDGTRAAVVTAFEIPRIAAVDPGIETTALEELGADELFAAGATAAEAQLEICTRACRRLGVASAVVPLRFSRSSSRSTCARTGSTSSPTASCSRSAAGASRRPRSPGSAAHSGRARPPSTRPAPSSGRRTRPATCSSSTASRSRASG